MPSRRALLLAGLVAGASRAGAADTGATAPALRWPRDFGSHDDSRIEWWYITGALDAGVRRWGFQITFFRVATGLAIPVVAGSGSGVVPANAPTSRFTAEQIVFAHAAVTDLQARRLRHDQRIARRGFGISDASSSDTDVVLRDWRLQRTAAAAGSVYRAAASSDTAGFRFDLALDATQPVLLQGVAGLSQKGPDAAQSSRYYSEPQLHVHGMLGIDRAEPVAVTGTAWLDHEWSDSLLDASAVGWDWLGMNLDDGAALTLFRIRRADGSTLWAGGSHRPRGGAARVFSPGDVAFTPGRTWRSPSSKALYPVQWRIATPVGAFVVDAVLDDQELDSRASTGSIYWEGLSRLSDAKGRALGMGYLEMTGYADRLRL